jgi:hypothetical protein
MKFSAAVFFLVVSLFIVAQSSTSNKPPTNNFVLLIDEKPFHNGDTIDYKTLKRISSHSVEVMDLNTQTKCQPTLFECVISVKAAETVWKFGSNQLELEPVHCANCCKSLVFKEVLAKMNPNDFIGLDQIQYSIADTSLPMYFNFRFKY